MSNCYLIFIIIFLLIKIEKIYYNKKKNNTPLTFAGNEMFFFSLFVGLSNIAYRLYEQKLFLELPIHIVTILLLIPSFMLVVSASPFFKEGLVSNKEVNMREVLLGFPVVCLFPELFLPFYLRLHQYKNHLYNIPVSGFGDTDQKLNTHICISFGVCSLLMFLSNFQEIFYSVSIGIISFYYFAASMEKLKHNWHNVNKLKNLVFCSKVQLNWSFIKNDRLIDLVSSTSLFAFVLQFFTPMLLAPMFISEMYQMYAVLLMLMGFHFLVFVSSGINFWKWKITILAMMAITSTLNVAEYTESLLYLFLYVSGFLYSLAISKIPIGLGWLDSPLGKVYKIYFKYEGDENLYRVRPQDIHPWDIIISQNRLSFLFPEKKTISGCLGAVRDEHMNNVLNSISESDSNETALVTKMMAIISTRGTPPPANHAQQTQSLFSFIHSVTSIKDKNRTRFREVLDNALLHIRDKKEDELSLSDRPSDAANVEKIVLEFKRSFYSDIMNKVVEFDKDVKVVNIGVS